MSFQQVINTKFFNEIIYFGGDFKIWCIFYIYSTSQFRPATFQRLHSPMQLTALVLNSKQTFSGGQANTFRMQCGYPF